MGISDSPLIASIRAAVQDRPEDVPLRLHLAELLLNAGEQADAITHVAAALQRQPDSAAGRELMSRAIGAPAATASVAPPVVPPDSAHDPSDPPTVCPSGTPIMGDPRRRALMIRCESDECSAIPALAPDL